ncbi:hypothetical protein OKA05_26745 [Luteolibacter arcticus]|uniref:Uncharacterized protein n=1 Tax=Luteolibacter arcticus TaxID=1581411 RepID=A0ABT3GRN0_9BACT|nr:hypothetical protein [Luteolibacter arcticus]MCW1926185.1 hypothetical protein [Luteolibacter arcticus]
MKLTTLILAAGIADGQLDRVAAMTARMAELDREVTAGARPAWAAGK